MAAVVFSPLKRERLATNCNRRNVGNGVAEGTRLGWLVKVSGNTSAKANADDRHLSVVERHNSGATNAVTLAEIETIPGELIAEFQTGFYAAPVDAMFKALEVE
jgi:predicted ATP-dependent Lon-type protease